MRLDIVQIYTEHSANIVMHCRCRSSKTFHGRRILRFSRSDYQNLRFISVRPKVKKRRLRLKDISLL